MWHRYTSFLLFENKIKYKTLNRKHTITSKLTTQQRLAVNDIFTRAQITIKISVILGRFTLWNKKKLIIMYILYENIVNSNYYHIKFITILGNLNLLGIDTL